MVPDTAKRTHMKERKPGAMKSFSNTVILPMVGSCGPVWENAMSTNFRSRWVTLPLRAIITEPSYYSGSVDSLA